MFTEVTHDTRLRRTLAIALMALALGLAAAPQALADDNDDDDDDDILGPEACERLPAAFPAPSKLVKAVRKIRPTVRSAVWVAATGASPGHCLVEGFVPTGNSRQGFNEVNFRLGLPETWNGKYFMVGGGGFAGSLPNVGATRQLASGYATIGTDTGHQGSGIDASWAQDNPTAVIDFGYRGVHVTAVGGKEVVEHFYDEDIEYSYFQGCSRGGGQALMEAQRFPRDFDGIIAGAPAYNWSAFMTGFADGQQRIYPDASDLTNQVLTLDKLPVLEAGVVAKCDAQDGIVDGIIGRPLLCDFDPAFDVPICAPGDDANPNCLSLEQVAAVKAIYDGPSNSQGQIFPGFPPGSESQPNAWNIWIVGTPGLFGPNEPNLHFAFADDFFRYLAYEDNDDGSFGLHDFDLEDFATLEPIGRILNATSPDLRRFKRHGGKLIIWTGWADPAITTLGTIDYFDRVGDAMGVHRRDRFTRLYLAPGMLHCSGGNGPNQFDLIGPLEDWVERGIAPQAIIAVHRDANGVVDIERPLCPHPQVAELIDPNGSTVEASNFHCVTP